MPEASRMIPIAASKRLPMPDAKLLGKSNTSQTIRVSIYVRRNPKPNAGTAQALEKVSAELPGKRHYFTSDEFNRSFGADPADLEKVANWAGQNKLKVIDSNLAKRRVLVQGTIGDIQRAFGTELHEYEHPTEGRFRGREGELHVPADLYGIIEGVFGLDTRKVGRPRYRRGRLTPVDIKDANGCQCSDSFPGSFFPQSTGRFVQLSEAIRRIGPKCGDLCV